ncbi:MAG: VanZ family protein [Clostridia bacterium]|nr:VanZ family protein [Clostridia bacterium]
MVKFRSKFVWLTLAVLWTAVIFALSLNTADDSNKISMGTLARLLALLGLDELPPVQWDALHHFIRKCAHFAEYFLLGALWYGYFCTIPARSAWSKAWGTAAITATADELLQRFVEGRSGQLSDVLLDSAGALTGILLMLLLRAIFRSIYVSRHTSS